MLQRTYVRKINIITSLFYLLLFLPLHSLVSFLYFYLLVLSTWSINNTINFFCSLVRFFYYYFYRFFRGFPLYFDLILFSIRTLFSRYILTGSHFRCFHQIYRRCCRYWQVLYFNSMWVFILNDDVEVKMISSWHASMLFPIIIIIIEKNYKKRP